MANQVGNGPLSSDEAEILSTDAPTALDPRLQRLVARRLYGAIERPATSTGQDEVAVIAKVTDRDAWEGLSEVRVGGTVGDAGEDGTLIVTARIPVTRIEYLRQQPFVRSLKATQPLQPTLNRTIAETGAIAALLPAGNQSDGAAGVVVGIVDFGFDFVHRNFRNPDGSTRAISIWRQAGPANRVRDKKVMICGFPFFACESLHSDTLGKEAYYARISRRARTSTKGHPRSDSRSRRLPQRIHQRCQRPLRQTVLPLPSARPARSWPELPPDQEGQRQDRE